MNKLASLTCAVLLLCGGRLWAHSDPRGDVHPQVRVEKGNFAIYFGSNMEEREFDEEPATLRMVYSPAGELLAPRHRVAEIPEDRLAARKRGGDTTVRAGGQELMFPPWPRLFHGKPFYTVTMIGRSQRQRLPWPDEVQISDLHSVVADERSITIAAKAGTPVLSLYHFSRERFQLPDSVQIGSPATIYDFPTASNLVLADGRFWIAWMRAGAKKFEAVLSSWKPGDEHAKEIVLDGPGDWNSNLSMEVSGDVLCLAYHCAVSGTYPGRSRIITIFHRVK